MRSTRRYAIFPFAAAAAVAAVAAVLLVPAPAHACSCIQPPPPAEALEQADAVFVGTVTAMDEAAGPAGFPKLAVRFALDTVYKGDLDDHVVVETAESSAACGYTFEEGETYLVYAYDGGEGANLSTSLCTRNALVDAAEEDLEAFEAAGYGAAEQADEGEGERDDDDC